MYILMYFYIFNLTSLYINKPLAIYISVSLFLYLFVYFSFLLVAFLVRFYSINLLCFLHDGIVRFSTLPMAVLNILYILIPWFLIAFYFSIFIYKDIIIFLYAFLFSHFSPFSSPFFDSVVCIVLVLEYMMLYIFI